MSDPKPESTGDFAPELAILAAAAEEAGARALAWFRPGEPTRARVDYKEGGSPVTEADIEVDDYLRETLGKALPHAGWLSEETADSSDRLDRRDLVIVDPIDGTRGFAAGDPRWAVSVALAREGRIVAAVIAAPALRETFVARAGAGARLNDAPLVLTPRRQAGASIAGPRPMIEPIAHALGFGLADKTPSLAVRFAHVAAGRFAAAVASPNARDWDIAAADLILAEAGARLSGLDGQTLRYNKKAIRHGALFAAGAELQQSLLSAARGGTKNAPAAGTGNA